MRIDCQSCNKYFDLPDNRLPFGKKVSFACPSCKSKITLDLRQDPQNPPENADTDKKVFTPLADAKSSDVQGDDLKRKILGSVKDLPPMPRIIVKAREIMNDEKASFKDIAKVIETDQAIATTVLKVANSAYYGLSGMVSSIHQASVVLGYKALEELITMASASTLLGSKLKGYRMNAGALWQHSLAVAMGSRLIAKEMAPKYENDAFSVGLIHDAGKLALDKHIDERKDKVDQIMRNGRCTFLSIEQQLFGFDHTELAAEMCSKWKLPENHVSAMRYHHTPSESKGNELAYIVHLANHLSLQCNIAPAADSDLYELEEGVLEFLGFKESDLERLTAEIEDSVTKLSQSK